MNSSPKSSAGRAGADDAPHALRTVQQSEDEAETDDQPGGRQQGREPADEQAPEKQFLEEYAYYEREWQKEGLFAAAGKNQGQYRTVKGSGCDARYQPAHGKKEKSQAEAGKEPGE